MSKADDFLHRHLDVSNFAALRASAAQAAARDHKLKSAADAAFTAEIGRIKDYAKAHPDDDFTRANTDLVSRGVPATSWTAVGNVSFTSAMWWAIGGGLAFPEDLPLAFLFGGKGFGWGAWATFTSIVGGQFLVDPQVIAGYPEFVLENSPIGWVKKGPCNFTGWRRGNRRGIVDELLPVHR